MNKKSSLIISTLLLVGSLSLMFNIQAVEASGTVYIRADGSIDPPTAPIYQDGNIYTFTDHVFSSIVVLRNNIIIDGSGYTVQGDGTQKGFDLSDRSNVTVKNTRVTRFEWGFYLRNSNYNSIINNTSSGNEDGITLFSSFYNTLTDNTLTSNVYLGIRFDASDNNKLIRNIASNNNYGIQLCCRSDYNRLVGNTASYNRYDGIRLENSNNNSLIRNVAHANLEVGIEIEVLSTHNKIVRNNVSANSHYGIVASSEGNVIYNNNIVDNAIQAAILYGSFLNTWDDGYPSGGNYWSDYTGVDADGDGIGDTPYVIGVDNQDNYPLISQHSAFASGDCNHDGIVNIIDAALVGLYWLQTVPPTPTYVDINGDGIINVKDAAIVGLDWLEA